MPEKNTILITRKLSADSAFFSWAEARNVNLLHQPFIRFEAVTGLEIPATDWLFFSSPSGARLYFENYPVLAKHVAALSSGTGREIKKHGRVPDFTGSAEKDPVEIGEAFFSLLNRQETVLFPLSNISGRSVSSLSDSARITELITYKTSLDPKVVNTVPAVIVFTSPSNVLGFLVNNEIDEGTKLVALGKTTQRQLKGLGFDPVHIPASTNERDVLALLDKLMG